MENQKEVSFRPLARGKFRIWKRGSPAGGKLGLTRNPEAVRRIVLGQLYPKKRITLMDERKKTKMRQTFAFMNSRIKNAPNVPDAEERLL